jgi:hypothetical protein
VAKLAQSVIALHTASKTPQGATQIFKTVFLRFKKTEPIFHAGSSVFCGCTYPPKFSRPASAFALADFLFSNPQPLEKYHEPLSAAPKRHAV